MRKPRHPDPRLLQGWELSRQTRQGTTVTLCHDGKQWRFLLTRQGDPGPRVIVSGTFRRVWQAADLHAQTAWGWADLP